MARHSGKERNLEFQKAVGLHEKEEVTGQLRPLNRCAAAQMAKCIPDGSAQQEVDTWSGEVGLFHHGG